MLGGVVAVSHDGTSFAIGQDGDLLQEGDVTRTGKGAHAVLTFFDGSVIELEPDSEIRVATLQATRVGDLLNDDAADDRAQLACRITHAGSELEVRGAHARRHSDGARLLAD